MFNRYWREYPVFLQLVLLMLMTFTMISFSGYIGLMLTGRIYGVSLNDIQHLGTASSQNVVNAGRFIQLVSSLFTFLGTALLFAYLTHPRPAQYLGFNKPVKNGRFLLVLLAAIAFIPLAEQTGVWMRYINLGKEALAAQQQQDDTYKAFLHMNTPFGLLQALFIFAVLPAIGEELFFRGVVMRFAYKGTRRIGLAIFISAAIFAFAHATLFNFPSILIAGLLLGYIYYETGSIWFCILFHFLNNGLQVVLEYMSQHKMLPADMQDMTSFPLYIVVISLAITAAVVWLLKKQQTPLPADWGADFDKVEIAAIEEEKKNS
jgi:membrane protease YdiL (CAAX protease family)